MNSLPHFGLAHLETISALLMMQPGVSKAFDATNIE
jgi:hypothetical protein